jgi:hypothetical protein
MLQLNSRLTTVLTIAGDYVEAGRVPLEIATDRIFNIEPNVNGTAKTVTLQTSGFSTQVPLLPTGWNSGSVWIVIQNNTGKSRQTYPTNKQHATELSADVIVGSESCPEMLRVRSGCIVAFEPINADKLYLYAPRTNATVRITYFPIR